MKDRPGRFANAHLDSRQMTTYCALDPDARRLLEVAIDRFALSARGYTRVLRVARTITDLEGASHIRGEHLAEAIQYRSADEGLA